MDSSPEKMSIENALYALPAEFLERLQKILPPAQYGAVISTFITSKPAAFRVNTIRAKKEDVRAALEKEGFQLEQVQWYKDAFVIRGGRFSDFQKISFYKYGLVYVQSLASMLPVLALDPKPGERVLDLTAAPGSKTTQMASLMKDEGRIVANDNNKVRFYKLQATVVKQGIGIVKLSQRHGESFGKSNPNSFDRVLVDAPCSTEGRFRTNKPASYRYWRLRKIHEMVNKQRKLLLAGVKAARPGGVLVYSTCTFAPEENEGVVDWVLHACNGAAELEEMSLPIPNTMPGLGEWDGALFNPTISRTLRVLPTPDMEGFFIARVRKLGP